LQDGSTILYVHFFVTLYNGSCAENNIPLLILDRPNPNGRTVDGPILEKEFSSFVGMHPFLVNDIGEYAQMINGEQWLKNEYNAN
jgi:uncharacterized protein YbbC (DUF1343 family)